METVVEESKDVNEKRLSRFFILRGLALAVLGLFIVSRPMMALSIVAVIVGLYIAVDGVFTVYRALRGRSELLSWKGMLIRGIVSIVIGSLVLLWPSGAAELTGSIIMYLLALQAIISGVMDLRNGASLPDGAGAGLNGALLILLGIFLVLAPQFTVALFVRIVGALVLAGAVFQIGFGLFAWHSSHSMRKVN